MRIVMLLIACGLFASASSRPVRGNSPTGYSPVIIARGEYREQIKSMPIECRPNRPLHFYGNVVRRNYYRDSQPSTPRGVILGRLPRR